ncbi:MAG: tRNA lysidine(34) synthetase TilS [Gammaproteobacteria bacterium]|nr:tRNA lysidine(34) synthetase TilS [Gammaproteobacteria bacterium]
MDSHVLLHAMHALFLNLGKTEIRAAHINHGLSCHAGSWSQHCERVCRRLRIPYQLLTVDAVNPTGQSPEAKAREQRYRALASIMGRGDVLLTAHHQDDQAETVLLQLLRGAGPRGLSAMPLYTEFGPGWLARPLLAFSRHELSRYAQAEHLDWIEDDSNTDLRFGRNYLRHKVMPVLRERWPGISRALARAARYQADVAALIEQVSQCELDAVYNIERQTLSVTGLRRLDGVRRKLVIRAWVRLLGLPVPSAHHVRHILTDVVEATWERTPRVAWAGAEVRRYRDEIYGMRPLPNIDPARALSWNLATPLKLASGILKAERVEGTGIKATCCQNGMVSVRFRRGGERLRPAGRGHTRPLQKLFQEEGIPPWHRDRIPLVYIDDELAAVAGLWVCDSFNAKDKEDAWNIHWHAADAVQNPVVAWGKDARGSFF